jgi:hypothetical protein
LEKVDILINSTFAESTVNVIKLRKRAGLVTDFDCMGRAVVSIRSSLPALDIQR